MSTEEITAFAKRPFRFFDLPPELRDRICDLLPCGRRIVQASRLNPSLHVWKGDCPLSQFMVVNKQFKDEYSQMASKHDNIRIHATQNTTFSDVQIVKALVLTSDLTFDFDGVDLTFGNDLDLPFELVKRAVAQVSEGANVRVRVNFDMTNGQMG